MPTKDYPFLAHWKRCGLDRFPDIPFAELVRVTFEREREAAYRKSLHLRILKHLGCEDSCQAFDERLWMEVERRLSVAIEDKIREAGLQLKRRERSARLQGEAFTLSPPRGGGVHFSQPELIVLKILHVELQDCIKEVRRANDLPLKRPQGEMDQDRSEDIDPTQICAWLFDLFDEQEIALLTNLSYSPADCALTIIAGRLRRFNLLYNIRNRTLKDLLKTVPV